MNNDPHPSRFLAKPRAFGPFLIAFGVLSLCPFSSVKADWFGKIINKSVKDAAFKSAVTLPTGTTNVVVESKWKKASVPSERVIKIEGTEAATILEKAERASDIVVPIITTEDGKNTLTLKTRSTQQLAETVDKRLNSIDKKALENVTAAASSLESAVESYLKDPTKENGQVRDEFYALTLAELVDRYSKTADPNTRAHLARQYGSFGSERKAWFGRDDNYRPEVYKSIYDAASSCVALVDSVDDRPFASGVLIGENLVLTCAHQVADRLADDLRVWFDYRSGNPDDPAIEKCRVLSKICVGVAPDDTISPLDFSVWKIERKPDAKQRQPLKLITHRVRRGVPIYLIGHPSRAPQTVHDNAWVVFPFEVTEPEMKELRIAVNNEFLGGEGSSAIATDHFMQSYVKITQANGDGLFRYIGSWGGRRLPLIGAECDTFKGNSGSPAILREKGELIGILVEGQPDQGEFGSNQARDTRGYRSGWSYHERLLPIREIVAALDKSVDDWRSIYQPRFSED